MGVDNVGRAVMKVSGAPSLSRFVRQGGVVDFVETLQNVRIKIPTLFLQKTEKQEWGTRV